MVVLQALVHLEVEKLASIGYAKVYINNIENKRHQTEFLQHDVFLYATLKLYRFLFSL